MNWYMEVLRKFAQFDGRARRTEYWMFTLINMLIYIAYFVVAGILLTVVGLGHSVVAHTLVFAPIWLYALAVLVPGLAVSIRRLHDTGRSGWWCLICFVPFIGGIVLLVFMCLDSEPGPNMYGINPKGVVGYGQMMPPPPPAY